jgi:MFS family permease
VTARRPLIALAAGVFLVETGAFGIVPVLPLYLSGRGIDYTTVGLLVGMSLLTAFLFQYPSGRLADIIGRRPLLVGGSFLYAAAGLALVLPAPIPILIAIRALQGLGIAAVVPSAYALAADLSTEETRGRAYSWLSGATLGGLTAGPAIAGGMALFSRPAVFWFAGASGLVAAALFRALPSVAPGVSDAQAAVGNESGEVPRLNVAAALATVGGIGVLFGSYETAWPLFMHHIGASDLVVGLSFSLFGLPYVVVTPAAGWAADRYDRRKLALFGYAAACGWAMVYPWLTSIPLILVFGTFEAVGLAFAMPALNAQVMHGVPAGSRGRIQGGVLAFQSGGQALGSIVGGGLFATAIFLPFYAGAAAGLIGAAIAAVLFRAYSLSNRPIA